MRRVVHKIAKTALTRATHFDSNKQQIVCWLGVCPVPHSGAYNAPRPLAVFRGATSKGRKGEGVRALP